MYIIYIHIHYIMIFCWFIHLHMEHIFIPYAPWCWNMNPNICPCPKSPSHVGVHIPAPWFAYGHDGLVIFKTHSWSMLIKSIDFFQNGFSTINLPAIGVAPFHVWTKSAKSLYRGCFKPRIHSSEIQQLSVHWLPEKALTRPGKP